MSVILRWKNEEKSVISCTLEPPWAWEETDRAWFEFNQMVTSVQHRVDCVVDAHAVGFVPKNALQIIYERYNTVAPNIGVIVIVSAPMIIKTIVDVLRRMRPEIFSHYQFTDTVEDAYRLIARNAARNY